MKQAILITAYKNYHHLEEIIRFFDNNFEVYIHLDKKSKISVAELASLKKYNVVKLISQKYKVNWGGFNHLKSILYLAEQSLKNPDIQYFHLISGHDFSIKKKNQFADFFQNNQAQYLEFYDIPKVGGADNGNMDRIEYYNFYDLFDPKSGQSYYIRFFIRLQKRLGFKRSFSTKFPKLYGGSTWWSLSRECLDYVVTYTRKNKWVLNRFRHTLCSEEFYFQTVIMNSPFAEKVVNDNLRYIDWVARNGNNPAVLDETDFEKVMDSNAFFARKFEYPVSEKLMNRVKMVVKR